VRWPKGGEQAFPVTGVYQGSSIVSGGQLVLALIALAAAVAAAAWPARRAARTVVLTAIAVE